MEISLKVSPQSAINMVSMGKNATELDETEEQLAAVLKTAIRVSVNFLVVIQTTINLMALVHFVTDVCDKRDDVGENVEQEHLVIIVKETMAVDTNSLEPTIMDFSR